MNLHSNFTINFSEGYSMMYLAHKQEKLFLTIIITTMICTTSVFGQVQFEKQAALISSVFSEIAQISDDLNHDQQDDFITFDDGNQAIMHLNNGIGRDWKKVNGPFAFSDVWAGLSADFDGDGYKEIVFGTPFSLVRIYTYNYHEETFTLYWQAPELFYVQNMNASDINNDGLLDLFICNDIGENQVFINNGSSGFIKENIFDFTTNPSSDLSGNYGSIFIDFDLDGDRDLYISKCSIFADDSTDPRRINQLFINDGDGNYTEAAEEYNLAFGQQTWVSNFADTDLDGDLDMIVANHDDDLIFLENQEGTYVQIQSDSGLKLLNPFWQLSFQDFDNDMYPDLLFTGDDIYYYHNLGNNQFEEIAFEKAPDKNRGFTYSIADFNNDGFYDFSVGYGNFQEENNIADSIFINEGNDNNWVKFRLEGSTSNLEAEGTRIELYANGIRQMRQVVIGHSYGIQDTKIQHFGLADTEKIDSVIIYWDGNEKQILSDIDINSYYYVRQAECIQKIQTTPTDKDILCQGQSLTVSSPENEFIEWNDGSNANNITTTDEDVIFATYGNQCVLETWKIYPVYNDTSFLELQEEIRETFFRPCPNENITLSVNGNDILWNNEVSLPTFISKEEGEIFVSYTDGCRPIEKTYTRINTESSFIAPDPIIQFTSGQDVFIDVNSENAKWYNSLNSLFHEGPSYTFVDLQTEMTFYIENEFIQQYFSTVGIEEPSMDASFPASSFNAEITIEVLDSILLKSIDAYAQFDGIRNIQIKSESEDIVYAQDFLFDSENITAELNAILGPGKYIVTTDPSTNISNFGSNGPLFIRESGEYITYPYEDESGRFLILENQVQNENVYYSFYNWQVESLGSKVCDFEEQVVSLKLVSDTDKFDNQSVKISNPVNNILHVTSKHDCSYEIIGFSGKHIGSGSLNKGNNRIQVDLLAPGMYYIKIEHVVYKFVKI